MEYPAYARPQYYNTVTGNPATYLFLRHRIGNKTSRESWIYYYEPNDNNSTISPLLHILSEKSTQTNEDYWHFALVTENHTFKPQDEVYFSFHSTEFELATIKINIDMMKLFISLTIPSGDTPEVFSSNIV